MFMYIHIKTMRFISTIYVGFVMSQDNENLDTYRDVCIYTYKHVATDLSWSCRELQLLFEVHSPRPAQGTSTSP